MDDDSNSITVDEALGAEATHAIIHALAGRVPLVYVRARAPGRERELHVDVCAVRPMTLDEREVVHRALHSVAPGIWEVDYLSPRADDGEPPTRATFDVEPDEGTWRAKCVVESSLDWAGTSYLSPPHRGEYVAWGSSREEAILRARDTALPWEPPHADTYIREAADAAVQRYGGGR